MRHAVLVGFVTLTSAHLAAAQGADIDPRIASLVTSVSPERLGQLVETLQSFHTRNTLSATDSATTGIGAARQWIHDEMQRSSRRLEVSFDTYRIPAQGERIPREIELRNVVATLAGRNPRRVYVSGHYDSLARVVDSATGDAAFDRSRGDNPAPGANDDGSGTVLTMELARVLAESGLEFDATLVFVAFAGEEQGLVGSKLHAQKADAERWRIDAVFNNDIVGNMTGGNGLLDSESVRVFSEGPEDSASRQIARYLRRTAARYVPSHRVRLIARHDRFGRGGDHTSFNQHGFPGVRVTEANENYARQHRVEDTADGVSIPYLAQNTRVNAAAVAALAMAPSAPVVVDDTGRPLLDRGTSGYDARLTWRPVPGAARYRVFWRTAWVPDWEQELDVGDVSEFVLPDVSIDDYIFGVSAVDAEGHESLVAAYVNPPRATTEIKTVR